MLNIIVTGAHAYTFENYFRAWGAAVRPRVRVWWYEDFWTRRRLPPGPCLFTDLERLTHVQLSAAARCADRLLAQGVRVLNHPNRLQRRYELLRTLHQEGLNPYQALRVHENLAMLRYPVFLRRENNHRGPITGLLHNRRELDAAIASQADQRHLLAVEYCHTADPDGMFRKYSVMKLGDRIVPRHVLFSRNWIGKLVDLMEPAMLAEEMQYLHANPDAAALRPIFDAAGVDYGRIDYSRLNGQIVVWEINTNPSMTGAHGVAKPRVPATALGAQFLNEAFIDLARDGSRHVSALRTPARRVCNPILDLGVALRRVLGSTGPSPLLRFWRRVAWHVVP